MQIERIILYGRNGKTRVLEFRTGELNIITGLSKTGKSALIDIIDYCLGAKECAVAEGVIRNSVRHYAIVLSIGQENVFICRPDPPSPQQTSLEIMVEVGNNIEVPMLTQFRPDFNPDSLKAFLTEKLGFGDNLSEPAPGRTSKPLEANFRHSMHFCFQEQGEIAQKGFLFHGARDTNNFVALAIRDTMSYFLGAVDDERPAIRIELREATRQLALAERRLNEAVTIGGQGFSRGLALLAEARQLSLETSTDEPSDGADLEARLTAALERASSVVDLPEIPGDVREAIQNERAELMDRLGVVRTQLEGWRNIGKDETGYEGALNEQRQRLESIGLFAHHDVQEHACPVCGSSVDLPTNSDFQSALEKLAQELRGVEASRPRVEAVIRNLEQERSQIARQLAENRLRYEALAAQDEEIRRTRDLLTVRARTAGRISLYLESGALARQDQDTPLRNAVDRAQHRVEQLRRSLDQEVVDSKLDSILSIVNRDITRMAAELQLEYGGNPMRFDPEKLTVIADTLNGPLPIARMGSGENWVAYHVMVHLALHRWFIQNRRPVPSFIVLDQPSQAQFPSDTRSDDDVDMNAVRRIYELIFRVVTDLQPDLQIIVTDHFDDQSDWFQKAVIERWRDGNALIPMDWIASEQK